MGMSKAEEEEQARLERARAIGLFRYMLIREAADPALSTRQRGKLVRAIAAREHADPSGRPVRLTRWTLDRWIRMRLRSILRRRQGRKGRALGKDHHRWPNAFFAERGLFSFTAAYAQARQSSRR